MSDRWVFALTATASGAVFAFFMWLTVRTLEHGGMLPKILLAGIFVCVVIGIWVLIGVLRSLRR